MKTIPVFNPVEMRKAGKVIESYWYCPTIQALWNACNESGFTRISCRVSLTHERAMLYVPEQQVNGFLVCHQLDRMRYTITRVSKDPDGETSFWLVTCSVSRYGYLLPIDAFAEDEVPTPAQCADMSALAA